jgi:hypothetical protein
MTARDFWGGGEGGDGVENMQDRDRQGTGKGALILKSRHTGC